VLRDPAVFADKWRGVGAALRCLPNFSEDLNGRVMFDILNEPDEYKCAVLQVATAACACALGMCIHVCWGEESVPAQALCNQTHT
jgi:hypothetical protein